MDNEGQNELSKGPASFPIPAGLDLPIIPAGHSSSVSKSDSGAKSAVLSPLVGSEYHIKYAEEIHQYVREYIRNADQKAAFFFAASSALFAFLKNNGALTQWLQSPKNWGLVSLLAFISTLGLVMCAGFSLLVVFPRRSGSKKGTFSFDSISNHKSGQEFSEEFLKSSLTDLLVAKSSHSYDLARICRRKYNLLGLVFWTLSIGSGATVFYLMLS